jgi:hypothetical protein
MLSKELAEKQFSALMERYKCSGQYQMVCKSSPNGLVDQVTILDLTSSASHSYPAAYPSESPRYWLTMMERALAKGTFGDS